MAAVRRLTHLAGERLAVRLRARQQIAPRRAQRPAEHRQLRRFAARIGLAQRAGKLLVRALQLPLRLGQRDGRTRDRLLPLHIVARADFRRGFGGIGLPQLTRRLGRRFERLPHLLPRGERFGPRGIGLLRAHREQRQRGFRARTAPIHGHELQAETVACGETEQQQVPTVRERGIGFVRERQRHFHPRPAVDLKLLRHRGEPDVIARRAAHGEHLVGRYHAVVARTVERDAGREIRLRADFESGAELGRQARLRRHQPHLIRSRTTHRNARMHHLRLGCGERDDVRAATRHEGELAGAHGLVHAHPQVHGAAFQCRDIAVFFLDLPRGHLRVGRSLDGLHKRHDRRPRAGGDADGLCHGIARADAKLKRARPDGHGGGELPTGTRRHLHALGFAIGGEHVEFGAVRGCTGEFHDNRLMIALRQPARVRGGLDHANLRPGHALNLRHGRERAGKLPGKFQRRHREQRRHDRDRHDRRTGPRRDQRTRQHGGHLQVLHPACDAFLHQVAERE